MTRVVLQSNHLTKRYKKFTAVDNLNLKVHQGEIFGMLGPNGSGKTTTILMLLGLTEPTSGTVQVLGFDPARQPLSVKAHTGYMPDQVGFYENLTARENLAYIARLNGLSRQEASQQIERALAQVSLTNVADNRVGTFSRGMRQRLGVADVLIKQPQLIIMDEPTQGLDPQAAQDFLDIIRDLKSHGITVLLSSHLLPQVQKICDRVGLFHKGKMVLEGTVPELAQQVLGGAYRIHLEADAPDTLTNTLRNLDGVVNVNHHQHLFELEAKNDLRPEAARAVLETGGRLLTLNIEMPGLDEIYSRFFKQEAQHVTATA